MIALNCMMIGLYNWTKDKSKVKECIDKRTIAQQLNDSKGRTGVRNESKRSTRPQGNKGRSKAMIGMMLKAKI